MKDNLLIILLILLMCWGSNVHSQTNNSSSKTGSFVNPVFAGDYPDPSLLVDGDDFYVVHSSFEYYPGLTIWHSKDLINWSPVTSALTQYVGSVWAPDLVKYKDKHYIYFPAGNTNYAVVSESINGPWSDPIDLEVGNIDPGHVADKEGNRLHSRHSGIVV